MMKKRLAYLGILFLCALYFSLTHKRPEAATIVQKKKIAIIVNPISGGQQKEKLIECIQESFDQTQFNIRICYTTGPHHATLLAQEAVKNHTDIVAVVGGDGSVNEVGQALVDTQTALAIIPSGSGNGIARHLQIPQETADAIDLIIKGHTKTIDTVCINDRHYLGVAGIGFDAEVSWEFAQSDHRGFISYLMLALKKLPHYRPQKYQLTIDGKELSERAFLICFANTSQFGNGAFIAPNAKVDDGYLEAVIIKKFPFYATPLMTHRLFDHSLHHSEYVKSISCREVHLTQPNVRAHIDGEPILFENGIHLRIHPASLRVITPS